MDAKNKNKNLIWIRYLQARRILVQRFQQDSPKLTFILDNFKKAENPMAVFEDWKGLWMTFLSLPDFSIDDSDRATSTQLIKAYDKLMQTTLPLLRRAEDASRLIELAVKAFEPMKDYDKEKIDFSEVEEFTTLMEHDDRFKKYLDCDIAELTSEWHDTELLKTVNSLVEGLEDIVWSAAMRLRGIIDDDDAIYSCLFEKFGASQFNSNDQ